MARRGQQQSSDGSREARSIWGTMPGCPRCEPGSQALSVLGKEPGSWEGEGLYKDMHTKHTGAGGGKHGGETSEWSSGEQGQRPQAVAGCPSEDPGTHDRASAQGINGDEVWQSWIIPATGIKCPSSLGQ